MLLGIGSAISSLVFGLDRGLGAWAQNALGDIEDDGAPDDITEEDAEALGAEITLTTLGDFIAEDGDDDIMIKTFTREDDWVYEERYGLENMLAGSAGDTAWFGPDEAASDPDAGSESGLDAPGVLYVDAGAGDDEIDISGHAPVEVVTGAGADSVTVGEGAGFAVIHADDGDSVWLADDWDGKVYGTGDVHVTGGEGGDTIVLGGDSTDALVHSRHGHDWLSTEGAGTLNGNAGQDTLIGYGDDAVLRGGRGADEIESHGANTIYGGDGSDSIQLGASQVSYSFSGSSEGVMESTRSDLAAGSTNGVGDLVDAGDGDDVISAIGAEDTVSGGAGDDIFHVVAEAGAASPLITDFEVGSDLLHIAETHGTLIAHGEGTEMGVLEDAEIDAILADDPSYQLDGRVSLTEDTEADTMSILIDGETVATLSGIQPITVGFMNGGDDTLYALDGSMLDPAVVDVIVNVHVNTSVHSLVI